MQDRFDAIISMSYDWLSYYLTPFLSIPVLHWVTIGSCLRVVDTAIAAQYQITPARFAFYSKAQATTFPFVDLHRTRILPGAVDLDRFHFQPKFGEILLWAARISPEKGLEAAVQAAEGVGVELHVCGKIQDEPIGRRQIGSANLGKSFITVFFPTTGFRSCWEELWRCWLSQYGLRPLE